MHQDIRRSQGKIYLVLFFWDSYSNIHNRTLCSPLRLPQTETGSSPDPKTEVFNSGTHGLEIRSSCYKDTRTLSSQLHPTHLVDLSLLVPATCAQESGATRTSKCVDDESILCMKNKVPILCFPGRFGGGKCFSMRPREFGCSEPCHFMNELRRGDFFKVISTEGSKEIQFIETPV